MVRWVSWLPLLEFVLEWARERRPFTCSREIMKLRRPLRLRWHRRRTWRKLLLVNWQTWKTITLRVLAWDRELVRSSLLFRPFSLEDVFAWQRRTLTYLILPLAIAFGRSSRSRILLLSYTLGSPIARSVLLVVIVLSVLIRYVNPLIARMVILRRRDTLSFLATWTARRNLVSWVIVARSWWVAVTRP